MLAGSSYACTAHNSNSVTRLRAGLVRKDAYKIKIGRTN